MYSKTYKSRTRDGPRYYGYLVSKRKGFSDITLRNDIYLIDCKKMSLMSYNRSPRQLKNFESADKSNHITIEKCLVEKGPEYTIQLTNHCSQEVIVDRDTVKPQAKFEMRSFQRVSLENEDNTLFLFVDARPTKNAENPDEINETYRMKECIGYGYTGNVFFSFSMKRMQQCALKRVNKEKFSEYEGLDCIDEFTMLKELSHPNIIELYGFQDTEKYLYLELEYAPGGNLFDRLYDEDYGKAMTEFQAKVVMYQITSAVAYMHRLGVTHRDIKPENMLLMSREDICQVKLADFGTSHIGVRGEDNMTSTACTVEHAAPEMLRRKMAYDTEQTYNCKVDCWSLGVVTYECLTARQPFFDDSEDEDSNIEDKIYAGNFSFFAEDWVDMTNLPKDLITSLLKPNVDDRLTAQEALQHEWFSGDKNLKTTIAQLTQKWRNTKPLEFKF